MDLILFGLQGSGKGTQSQKIAERYHLQIFETGAYLRKLAQQASPLGKKVKAIITAGHLVPHTVVMEIVSNFLHKLDKNRNVLFDGIPRSREQNNDLLTLLKKTGRLYQALLIDISKAEALHRLTTRRLCRQCKTPYPAFYKKKSCAICGAPLITRHDDNLESIKVRLETYQKETQPIIHDYLASGKLIIINGQQSIDKVSQDIFKELDKILTR